ncbi:hypothetical protein Leryth_018181 [Lithospermum erythrorhizon]|nr:hypothetical protein Leryth_018181 [Lithospermum erythrorhizon]
MVKSQRRLGFSLGTIFNAANYLDRFISSNKCQGWNIWMFELLSIACLSVAAKFNETNTPPLSEFQADDDLGHCFEWRLIQRMELTLLKAIGWRLTPTTPFSYMEMLTWSLRSMNSSLSNKIIDCITELLIINALLDYKLLEFRPFTIAMSAIRFVSEELLPMNSNAVLQHFNHYWNSQDYQGELLKCQEIMSKRQPIQDQCLLDYHCCNNNNCCGDGGGGPTSPITVLFTPVDNDQSYTSKKRYPSFVTQAQICTQITSNDFNPSKRMKKEGHPPA